MSTTSGKREVSFEVYVRQGGRWVIQARYESHGEKAAVADAQALEKVPGVDATKVTRETYDLENGTSFESTIYRSASAPDDDDRVPKGGKSVSRGPSRSDRKTGGKTARSGGTSARTSPKAIRATRDRPETERRRTPAGDSRGGTEVASLEPTRSDRRPKRHSSSTAGIMAKIGLIIVFAVAVASLATLLTAHYLGHTVVFGFDLGSAETLVGLFTATFLLTAIPFSVMILSRESLDLGSGGARREAAPELRQPTPTAEVVSEPAAPQAPEPETALPADDEDEDDEAPCAPDLEAPPVEMPTEIEEVAVADEEGDDTAELPDTSDEPDETDDPGAAEDEPADEKPADEKPAEDEPAEDKPREAPTVTLRKHTLRFIGDGLNGLDPHQRALDAHTRFGLSLFMAGACEAAAAQHRVDAASAIGALGQCAMVLGHPQDQAMTFARRYEEYLLADIR